jgi:hypothetical protein
VSCDGRSWYEAVTAAYVCVVLHVVKGIVVIYWDIAYL